MSEPRKRTAFEPALRLANRDDQPTRPARRPTQVSIGVVLMVLRAVAGALWLWSLAANWTTLLSDDAGVSPGPDLSEEEYRMVSDFFLTLVLVSGGVVLATLLVFAWLVWAGIDWARIFTMIIASLSVAASAVEWVTGGQDITLPATFLTLSLDILVLLALSSRPARAWSRPGAILPSD
ncbi:hypothetical protein [Agromyces seonyuensis]|uniref:Uncharacterized protein n=1 Tax=Agromyces seonyuensis TaxID=2662446 RepID=A0A6I4P1G3_9MICO|nr:hypothetical protein [Agromyces seonyuensis]MWB98575.1 hypothetical protein [Agromyces seonyuensis]